MDAFPLNYNLLEISTNALSRRGMVFFVFFQERQK